MFETVVDGMRYEVCFTIRDGTSNVMNYLGWMRIADVLKEEQEFNLKNFIYPKAPSAPSKSNEPKRN
ncbi:hypothetical protein [Vibrio metschnikovii]|uniref:Uncharacterized protein n=1 Tax=Vibrio metschnikovii TaxID=28172 RepID=A0A9X0R9V4_VIBME|nr:hypothetical protein [Vibrio metschnikovii]MBC5852147.1 hypothetical protein [Vibrio metschnikovii]